jgi:hypothetical protein
MEPTVTLDRRLMVAVLNYLATKPYQEVCQVIPPIEQALQPKPPPPPNPD